MKQYLNDLQYILKNDNKRRDRTGTGTIGVFGMQSRYNLADGFPAVTTKKLAWKAVVSELLWFIEGGGDERRLAEILHGTRDPEKKTIWTANANADYWTKGKFIGDLGRVYGMQWRSWQTFNAVDNHNEDDLKIGKISVIDQLANVIESIKIDPFSRRHIVTAWNPGELNDMALPPCHIMFQFYVSKDYKLSCQLYQRSADFFLGVPFNIASYALLTHMVAQVCELDVGDFVHTIGDAHIYTNHIDAVNKQLRRETYELPSLWLNPNIKNIDDFTMDDIKLVDYNCHPSIPAPMAV